MFKLNEDYQFDTEEQQLLKNGEEVKLTHKEKLFLTLLCQNKEQVVSYERIQESIWYDSFMSDDALRSLVRNLRKNSLEI